MNNITQTGDWSGAAWPHGITMIEGGDAHSEHAANGMKVDLTQPSLLARVTQ